MSVDKKNDNISPDKEQDESLDSSLQHQPPQNAQSPLDKQYQHDLKQQAKIDGRQGDNPTQAMKNNEHAAQNVQEKAAEHSAQDTSAAETNQTEVSRPAQPLDGANKNTQSVADSQQDEQEMRKNKRSARARNQLIILANFAFSLVIVAILAGALGVYFIKNTFNGAGPSQEEQIVVIQPGTGIREIGALLENKNIIRSANFFVYIVSFENRTKDLKAGEFSIPAHASIRDIMEILRVGKSVSHTFTVPEGLTVKKIFDRLQDNENLQGPLPSILPAEGSLMTNTVSFTRGTTRQDIVKRLENAQKKLVDEIWERRSPDVLLKNKQEMVILASIVEKETGIAAERPQVAAVFYNRLKQNMRLQSDPTVLYGLFGGEGRPADRTIYRADLQEETPYNTYKIKGLPPTPIANPGRDALEAVANPPKSDAIFFVADGRGGHVFSKTLGEHNSNVKKWRAIKKERSKE